MDIGESVAGTGRVAVAGEVRLSTRLLTLLSSQLYKSPLKAIEELAINSYDAGAARCLIGTNLFDSGASDHFVAVMDDGIGMDESGLRDLWAVGRSKKRDKPRSRKQIGKFGIGKLAAHSLGDRLTHISMHGGMLRAVSVDFKRFRGADDAKVEDVSINILEVDLATLKALPKFQEVLQRCGSEAASILSEPSWTLAIIEALRPEALRISCARLLWVLRTAMPLSAGFALALNGEVLASSKDQVPVKVSFKVAELKPERIAQLAKSTGVEWSVSDGALVSTLFPSGVSGEVKVFERAIVGGKSDDLMRSHGFFVRVHGRLVNEGDPLFGLAPQSHGTFNSMRADICADDLDSKLLSSREEIEDSKEKQAFVELLHLLFLQARSENERIDLERFDKERHKREEQRQFVGPRLIDRPIADFLTTARTSDKHGSEPDETWFYIDEPAEADKAKLVESLYAGTAGAVKYVYDSLGPTGRVVKLRTLTREFVINVDHEYVRAHQDVGGRQVLEDFLTAEALLEVYLRDAKISPFIVGEVLEWRDQLLRGLAKDHAASVTAIAAELRAAKASAEDLEVALIRAARCFGFVANHISGAGEPDGLARLVAYPEHDVTLTLEAKASAGTPSLGALDFAGLVEHKKKYSAQGALVVAPSFPGSTKDNEASAAVRAVDGRISCWTVDLLADVVEAVERRHITARDIVHIVVNHFSPDDVGEAVAKLLGQSGGDRRALYRQIIAELRELEYLLQKSPRRISALAARMVTKKGFEWVSDDDVRAAVSDLAGASQGALALRGDELVILVSLDELQRRVKSLTGSDGPSRRLGALREQ